MTTLVWDKVGERRFETGVDRGVLFLSDGRSVVWNGLTGIEDSTGMEVTSYYMDGVKFLQRNLPGDFEATLKAFTYPEEFEEVIGIRAAHPGLTFYGQTPQPFNLCYRTKIGNDVDGVEHGYRIHILYNVMAVPSATAFQSLNDSVSPIEFSWQLSGVPSVGVQGFRPTVHISIDSTKAWAPQLQDLENKLYGTDTVDPVLPSLADLTAFFLAVGELLIVDNGDGTWTAYDAGDNYIVDDGDGDSTTFEIDNADVVYDDAVTYEITDTRDE